MRKFALCAVIVGLMAAPLLADPAPIRLNDMATISRTPVDSGTRDIPGAYPMWDGLAAGQGGNPSVTGYWGFPATNNVLITPGFNGFVGEDMHCVDASGNGQYYIDNFHFVAFGGPVGPFSTVSTYTMLIGFKSHPYFTNPTVSGPTIALFALSGLIGPTPGNPGGGWLWTVTFTNDFPLLVPDVWMFMANNANFVPNGNPLRYGMTAPANPAPIGALTHPYIFSGSPFVSPHTGSFFTLNVSYGPLMFGWALHSIPEPASLLLLAGGVLALRRRK
jgi:hypothetical protein